MAIRQQPKTLGQALQQFQGGRGVKTEPVTVVSKGSTTAYVRTASGFVLPAAVNGASVNVGDTVTMQDDRGRLSIVAGGAGAGGAGGGGALFTGGSAVTYSGAPSTASYLTLGSDATLTSERVFTKGSGLDKIDGGAGGTYTLFVGQGNGITVNTNDVAVNQGYGFTWTASHDFQNGFYVGSDVLLSRIAANTLALGTGDSFRSQGYTSGVSGWQIDAAGTAEFENVRVRGELSASVFKINEMSATAGTLGVWYSAAAVYADFTTPASVSGTGTMQAKNSDAGGMLFGVNDYVQLKSWTGSGVSNAWLRIDSRTNNTTYTTYGYTLMSGSTSATFRAGTAIADWGPTGSGAITLSADGTIGSTANLSIMTHAGSPWSSTTLVTRLGNLNGSYGVVSNNYGIGLGDYSGGNYLKYDTSGGFEMASGDASVYLDASGMRLKMPVSSSISYADQSAIGWATSPDVAGNLLSYISAARSTGGVFPSNTLRVFSQDTGALRQALVEISAYNNTTGGGPSIFVAAKGDGADEITAVADTITLNGSTTADKINVGTATGAGTGEVRGKNGADALLGWVLDSGSTSAQTASLYFSDRGTTKWATGKNGSNSYVITESGVSDRMTFAAGGNITATGLLRASRNSQAFDLVGTDHVYMGWYPDGDAGGRKAYMGFASASDNNLSIINEISGASIAIAPTGTASVLLGSATTHTVGIGTSSPQAKLHTYDTDGGTLHNWRTTGIAGTRVTIIPNGTGDCTQSCTVMGTAYDSSGNAWELRGSLESGVSAGSEQTVQVAGDATDNLHVKVKTDGQIEIVRNAGARTWSVCLSAWWR